MFDNLQEPKDMLAEVDPPLQASPQPKTAQMTEPAPIVPTMPLPSPVAVPASRRGLFLLIAFVLFTLVGVIIGYIFWRSATPSLEQAQNSSLPTPSASSPVTPSASVVPTVSAIPEDSTVGSPAVSNNDSDGDGLLDAEELELGTNIHSADSDLDDLGDREEVKVYHTDPLKADTDGDGYQDGQEVRGGYNPLGPGKLLQLPK